MTQAATKSIKLFFNFQVKFKVTSNWPWFQLKGRDKCCMHAKYEVSISFGLKVIAKVKVDNRQTNKQTDKQTDRQDKNNMPKSFDAGH